MGKTLLILLFIYFTACPVEAQITGGFANGPNDNLCTSKFIIADSSSQTSYIYKFKSGRVFGELAAGIGLGAVGLLGGALLGKGLFAGETGEFPGFAQIVIGAFLGYCVGTAGGVTLVSSNYNRDVSFLSTFAASTGGAVAGILLVDWDKGGDWRASLPFIMPIVFSVVSSEVFYPSRVILSFDQNTTPYQTGESLTLSLCFQIPLN